MRGDEKVIYFTNKEKIRKVIKILELWPFNSLRKSKYYEISLMAKNTDENLLRKYYSQFERVKLIALRERKNKNSNYDIYYELEKGNAILYAIDLSKKPPIIINAFIFNRSLKKFIRYLLKKYGKEMV